MKLVKAYLIAAAIGLAVLFVLPVSTYADALTSGETYTITIEAIQSDGSSTSTADGNSLGLSTTAVADSDGKLSFSLSGVPTSDTYNFLVVTIKDSAGTTARKSVVPAPAANATLKLGVSGITEAQTDGFISAFAEAGADDSIMALMGYLIVRSSDLTADEITTMGTFCYKGIKGTDGTGLTDGYEAYLRSKGATDAIMATFRKNIVAKLAEYSELYKDSVDDYFSSGSDAEAEKKGEAAANLMQYLVDAGSDAGIDEDDLLLAMQAMGVIVVPLMMEASESGAMRPEALEMIDSQISVAIQKLRADKSIAKYTSALTLLEASEDEISRFTDAANDLKNTMLESFQAFEKSINEEDLLSEEEMAAADAAQDAAMEAAFNTFTTACASTEDEIEDLRSRLATALGLSEEQKDMYLQADMFTWYTSDGTTPINWPIMMTVTARWMATVLSNDGSLTYDPRNVELDIPEMAEDWMGTCDNPEYWDKGSCLTNLGTWTPGRRDYAEMYPPEAPDEVQTWAALQGLQEDIMIIEMTKWEAFMGMDFDDPAASMTTMLEAEELFYERIDALKDNFSGTTDGSTAVSAEEKDAVITLYCSPDF